MSTNRASSLEIAGLTGAERPAAIDAHMRRGASPLVRSSAVLGRTLFGEPVSQENCKLFQTLQRLIG
jgi:hypothetical protein